ncbi:metalloregulator ArsR/SmtB family transcription factor [Microbacterium sp. T2.11-28]|jgi:DNA-binding transcriptional ArsR family regulator|uniref:ArsR/SmtB family transcription factor n=1 Tax=Microbacterium sp. T2.11-28 TaxID=3041169 RepID=UPI0024779BBF|nr:metalloregulator ArsR/SmtB family transcription factor [Microbacterium sp. T2.11-28]CAI9387252.1 HTH-type transcriptional regulator KmtR [Microbacterium sp. T2.11-28]
MHADTHEESLSPETPLVDVAVEVFRLLSDATRVRIILALKDGELSVNHLADILDRPAASVSQHLAKLRWARLVHARQDGNRAFYSLVDEHALRVVKEALLQAEHSVDERPAHHA